MTELWRAGAKLFGFGDHCTEHGADVPALIQQAVLFLNREVIASCRRFDPVLSLSLFAVGI